MKITIDFEHHPNEMSSHLRRKIIQFFNLLWLRPIINSPSSEEWTKLTIETSAPEEDLVDASLPVKHSLNSGYFYYRP